MSDVQNTGPRIQPMPPSPETNRRYFEVYCPQCTTQEGMYERADDPKLIALRDNHRHGDFPCCAPVPVSPATTDGSEGSRKTIAKLSPDRAALIAELRKAASDRQHMGTNSQRFVRAADALVQADTDLAEARGYRAGEKRIWLEVILDHKRHADELRARIEAVEGWITRTDNGNRADPVEPFTFDGGVQAAVNDVRAAIRNQKTGENQ